MVLGDDFHSEVVFVDVDIWVLLHSLYQALLNLETGVVGMVEDTEFGVAAFAVEVECAVGLAVEVDSPLEELTDLGGSLTHHFLHGLGVGNPVAGNHCVVDMLFEVVDGEVGDRSHSSLRQGGVGLMKR